MDDDYEFDSAPPEEVGYLWELRALNALRFSSQVCAVWRAIILKSSTLWASVLDLECLNQINEDWRNEVLRRTGQALLSLRGLIDGENEKIRSWFSSVVAENWDRIQQLDVTLSPATDHNCQAVSWMFLVQPSKYLRRFCLNIRPPTSTAICTQGITYPLQGPWLSQLRQLSLSQPNPRSIPSTYHLLDILRTMPLLESLQLTIRENLLSFYILLHCIHPGDGCCLFVEAADDSQGTIPFDGLENMQDLMFMWSSGYFKVHPPKALRIHMKQLEYRIIELPFHPAGPQTRFYSSFRPAATEHARALHHFASLDQSFFQSLTYLDIEASPDNANDSVFRFLFDLDGLEVSSMPFSTLQFLSSHLPPRDKDYITLPSLQTLTVRNIKQEVPNLGADAFNVASPFTKFLTWRQGEVPLKNLDLTECGSGLPNMGFLDTFTGLNVIWTGPGRKEESYSHWMTFPADKHISIDPLLKFGAFDIVLVVESFKFFKGPV
ncbi:unnamed protein product [Cyclocybe aegerita]|uniref:F-box domain-containing protein n=1 Tax=Cyclocybe aegerita TaxID=1973307 RepID=A0A8S0X250_CYCAE|nr:unnamed protein product [Cyclocybe aegerita]